MMVELSPEDIAGHAALANLYSAMNQPEAALRELKRIIELDPRDVGSSAVLYPARSKPSLDWETINKLCEQNADFEKFLQDVKIDYESKRVHRAEYDPVEKDIVDYVRNHLKIEPSE
jgi:tetratricopeptide (TPR) repeat protein